MLLKRVDPRIFHTQPGASQCSLQMRYLGTAGFVVEGEGHTLVLDPYVSRPDLVSLLVKRLVPNDALIERLIPYADDVLVGHAHIDHILDAPSLCERTSSRLIGSPAVCNVGRAAGMSEDMLVQTQGREDITSGPALIRGLPARHGKVYFNRVSLPGDIPEPPPWPPRTRELRHGLVLNWYVELAGVRVVHVDSADFIEEELAGITADVVCLCAIGRRYRPNYVADAVRLLKPKVIVPCHWDYFCTPYDAPPRLLPQVDLDGMVSEIHAHGVQAAVLPFDGVLGMG
ncbi:MAG: MBL fold metallo-hydrolase [Myxococcota bacterium]